MNKQKPTSPKKYILTQARKLPIHACYINPDWKESGLASIIVARGHSNGNFTIGIYLADLLARGVKDTFYLFNQPAGKLREIVGGPDGNSHLAEAEYNLVHNIIYGANAYAEDHGFTPHKEFLITQFILEEDTEDIELIEIEFGRDGKPLHIETMR